MGSLPGVEVSRETFEATRDHWGWRPGWGPGTRYLTFHLTFEHAHQLGAEAARLRAALAAIPHVDPVPPQWLHLTMTGVGHVQDVDPTMRANLARTVFEHTAGTDVCPLLVDGLIVAEEGIYYHVGPEGPLHELKAVQEQVVHERLGVWHREPGGFRPHISLAYFSGPVDVDLVMHTLRAAAPVDLELSRASHSMIELGRDDGMYTWQVVAETELHGRGR